MSHIDEAMIILCRISGEISCDCSMPELFPLFLKKLVDFAGLMKQNVSRADGDPNGAGGKGEKARWFFDK
jgi:hypothetical protein